MPYLVCDVHPGWFKFNDVCGEDKIRFDIWAEGDTVDSDVLVLDYNTRASVTDYFDLVGEATSCWYIQRKSEAVQETGKDVVREIYLK